MSSSQSEQVREEKHRIAREARSREVAKEVEDALWTKTTECIFFKGFGSVVDVAFQVDRKAAVVQALKNILKKLED